ncbi:Methyltransferase type 12 [Colletotrichum higginsianum IMI 349063]|uniref:Methyltransferase type 12 n=2 Tax=Colletotrichum higginsianum (strain IMI 349063) TaxID=759273 RepID=A0A1B7XTL7_COLHI|nr:Methyltransferase type 12 [Colletotrichum higginsianum IMI 349063]OBR03093.1 Methyltransferase type 12 [Colletotrichum higginsianum IMI 349063]GJD05104.1 methyltransferase type 12 [Colletotrichum higginsianum]
MASSLLAALPGYSTLEYHFSGSQNRTTSAGVAVYNSWTLSLVYDRLVLDLYLSYVWRCPKPVVEDLYAKVIAQASGTLEDGGLRIIDIGVGTGYFVSHAPIPPKASLTLFDLNQSCLDAASERCRTTHKARGVLVDVDTICGDFLAPESSSGSVYTHLGGSERSIDLIFTTMLLHCVPGPPARKASALARLSRLLKPTTGTLAGVTILGDGAAHNWAGRSLMFLHNLMGWFGNSQDDEMAFVRALEDAFEIVEWKVVGAVLVFQARSPRL